METLNVVHRSSNYGSQIIDNDLDEVHSSSKVKDANFAINGRFLSQSITGVQRYAREITAEIDRISGVSATIHLPANANVQKLSRTNIKSQKFGSGHIWEQAILPFTAREPLLNLCNLAPILRKKQIVCIHDANVFNAPESYSRSFRMAYHFLLPQIAKRSKCITTVSNASAADISKHLPINQKDITVLPNGHEHIFDWDARRSTIFKQHPLTRPYVLLLGSRAAHKNMQLIFNLADELDKLGLDIRVTGNAFGIFASQKNRQPLSPNIIELGFVNDDDLAALLMNALCLVFPSFTEGFGLPLVEAMGLKCPVISSNRASMPEICGEAALLAPPDDSELWLKHIKSLAGSRDLQLTLKQRGVQQVKQFSWQFSALGYIELINRYF